MRRLWFVLLLLIGMAGTSSSQEPPITPETPVDDSILLQWLHSGDLRLIAWAADFARRTHNSMIVAQMPGLLEHWNVSQVIGNSESQAAQRRAAAAVLDALIQENARPPASAIEPLAESFPAQAVILIGRLPLSESRRTLEDWSYGGTGGWSARTLARIATMMLAKDPGSSSGFAQHQLVGFVASVVAASEEELQITVRSVDNVGGGIGGSSSCADSFGRAPTPSGWPQVYWYGLEENDPNANGQIVVDLDGDRIIARRFEYNAPWGSCSGVQELNAVTRHRLIAYWLNVPEKGMLWQPTETYTIVWTNKAAYEMRLGELTETARKKLHDTVEALRKRGLMTEVEATTVAPKLVVSVGCEIEPCPLF